MEELDDEEYWKREEFERLKFYESEGNLRWIWGAGLYLGKNMIVTSVVISTAPLILPPLVALSAIGFAFSLPAGFALATYACTDKLMNALLPMPLPSYLEPAYEENDDIGSGAKEFEEVTQKKVELVEDGDRDRRGDRYEIPVYVDDEPKTWMGVTAIVEEYVGEVQSLDSNVIPIIIEGVQEAENEISLMESEGVMTPKDTLLTIVVEADVDEENEDNVDVTGVLAFVPQTDMREENTYKGELTDPPKGEPEKSERNGGFPIKDLSQETGDKILFLIPEGTEGLDKTISERRGKGIEQPEVVIERKVVVNEVEMADEGRFDGATEVQDSSLDSLDKRPQGEDLTSDSGIDASTDYLEVRIKPISISGHTEIGLDQGITSRFDKVLINEEKIWEQFNAMRTIIGCKSAAHESCVEELKVLYEFTGIDLPVSSKDGIDLADVNEKLHFLKSIVGVK